MELETIFWARLRALKANHGARISVLEGHSTSSLQRSDERWQKIKWLSEVAPKIVGLLRVLFHISPLIIAGATAAWMFLLPGLRWLWRLLSSSLAWLAGLGAG